MRFFFSAALVLVFASSAAVAVPARDPIDAAERLVRQTNYKGAEEALGKLRTDRASLLLARVQFETGRYDAAQKTARAAAASDDRALFLAKLAIARGTVDEAQKQLESLAGRATLAGRRARLMLGELLINRGKRGEAEPHLLKFADEYSNDVITNQDAEGLAMVGRAMALLRSVKDANRAFNESEKAERGRVETLKWRADLFIDNYDTGHAQEVLEEGLKVAPHDAELFLSLARVKLEQSLDFDGARQDAQKALAIHPHHPDAAAILAGLAIRDNDLKEANRAIARGFETNPHHLELWALKAAVHFLADDPAGYEAAKREALKRNPEFARFFIIASEYAEWEHRYDDIVKMMKEATTLDPKYGRAWAELGLMQMRGGDEVEGQKSLEEAWRHDKFNVRAFNTLERLYKDWIPNGYETVEDGIFKFRFPKQKKAIFMRYIPRFSARAWSTMKNRYGFVPTTPIQIELYDSRQHFSVRTSGLPNIGIQGVCFGRVLAAMSPESEPFNWGNVIWHELGHVFAIQLSKSHVPRWFTEGLSEYETIAVRPEWGRELDPELYLAVAGNKLPSVVDMNQAFTHATSGADVSVAYYASSQLIVYMAEKFGMRPIVNALSLWGGGVSTPQVLELAFGLPPADLDAGFRTWLKSRLSRYEKQFVFSPRPMSLADATKAATANPKSADALVDLALAQLPRRDRKGSQESLDKALALDPSHKGAHFLYAKLARLLEDAAGEKAHLAAIEKAGGDGYVLQMQLAMIAKREKNKAAFKAAVERAHRFDPSQAEALRALLSLATEEKNDEGAITALRQLVLLEQHDVGLCKQLLALLVKRQAWREAARVAEAALYIAVDDAKLHEAYALVLGKVGDNARAEFERESAKIAKEADDKPGRAGDPDAE
jgi:tetratricopeptide (TPR) repeat protein